MMHRIGGLGSLETKFCSFDGALALKEGAEIAGYASLFGAADQGGDVVQKGAYGASLARLAKARSGVKMLWQHDPTRPIGVWDEVREDGRGPLREGPAAPRGAGGARGARAAAGGRDRRAVDRLPHAQERRPRAGGGCCTRSSSGRCRWSPSRCSPRRGCRRMPCRRRRRTWRGRWRRASARPGQMLA